MNIIGARLSDWTPTHVHPLRWFVGFACAIVVFITVLATLLTYINGG